MCYIVPVAAAVVTSLMWRRSQEQGLWMLNLMFYGGALFGIIDHLWNGELLVVPGNAGKDLFLGTVITLGIFFAWGAMILIGKRGGMGNTCCCGGHRGL